MAAIHFNTFSHHADRVKMANIAQMVNVLQAMILTSDEKMVLTPTYYAFEMYKPFMDATYLPLELSAPAYQLGEYKVPAVHASAVRGKNGKVYVALANLNPKNAAKLDVKIAGAALRSVGGQILTAPGINSINTFEKPDTVKPQPFSGARLKENQLSVNLPSKSVVVLALQ